MTLAEYASGKFSLNGELLLMHLVPNCVCSGIVRAFNNNPSGGNGQYWEIELETLQDNDDVEWIYDMHDGATDADDYADVLKGKEEDSDDEEVEDEDAEGEDDDGIF